MCRRVPDDRKASVIETITYYISEHTSGTLKKMGYRRPQRSSLLLAWNRKVRQLFVQTDQN